MSTKTPNLDSYNISRANGAGVRAKDHLRKALSEVDRLFVGLTYLDETEPSIPGVDNGLSDDLERELNDLAIQGSHRVVTEPNHDNNTTETSSESQRRDWSSIRNVRDRMEDFWKQFDKLATELNTKTIIDLREGYRNAKGLRETGVFAFHSTITGPTPNSLRSIFAITSLSYVVSCLLHNRKRLPEESVLAGVEIWMNAIQDRGERDAFATLARRLWPEARNHIHFLDFGITEKASQVGEVLRGDQWASARGAVLGLGSDTFLYQHMPLENLISSTIPLADQYVKIWDAATGALQHTLQGHRGLGVTSVAFSADGRLLASGSDDENPRSSTFDHDVSSKGTRPSTIPTSHPSTKAQMPLQESVVEQIENDSASEQPEIAADVPKNEVEQDKPATRDCDVGTTYSVDTLSDDPKLRYLQVFADQLVKDIHSSGDFCIDNLVDYLDPVLREFAWRLYGESSNPFQWEASVVLHRKRKNIIDLLGPRPLDIDVIEVREDDSITSENDENEEEDDGLSSRVPFIKPRVMVMEWVGDVEESSSAAQEATALTSHSMSEDPIQEEIKFNRELEEPFTAPNQEDLPQLPHYEEFIRESDAYQWLLTKIRQHGQLTFGNPDAMSAIGTRIRKLLRAQEPLRKMSSRKPPALVRMTFNLDWNPVRFMQEAGFAVPLGETLLRVLCLTGSWDEAQATKVIDYMDQTWPRSGRALLALLQNLLSIAEGEECYYQVPQPKSRIGSAHPEPMATELIAKIQPPSACTITVSGSLYFVSEIGEQIGWLASALRPSLGAQGALACTPLVQDLQVHIQDGETQETTIVGSLTMAFDFQNSEAGNSASGYCWGQLFSNPILVRGYPILRRSLPNTGLEISLNIMSTIVGSKQVVQWGERVFMKGFNMLMIATLAAADVIVWHLLVSDKPDERISYIDKRLDSIGVETSQGIHLRMLEARRHVIGWCSKATDFCGDSTANQNLKTSGLQKPPASIVIDRMYLEAGSDIAGVNISFNQKQKPFWLEREKDYPSMLKWVSLQPVVFYDVEDRQAWLVDGASALLHLVRVSLHLDENDPESTYDWVFDASKLKDKWTGVSGRLGAIKTLKSWDNLDLNIYITSRHRRDDGTSETKYSTLRKRVEKTLHSIEILIDWQAQTASKDGIRILQKLDLRRDMIGFDVLDVITPLGPIHPRIKYIDSWGPGWVDLITSIGITTIFGHGFGDLIRPDPNEAVCQNWKYVPKGVEYLATSVSTLQMLYAKRLLRTEPGLSGGELTSKIEWNSHSHPFKMCGCLQSKGGSNTISSNSNAGDKHCHINPVQFLVGRNFWKLRVISRGLTPVNLNTLDKEGAVVFGHLPLRGPKGEAKNPPGQQKTGGSTSALSSNASSQGLLQTPGVSSAASMSTVPAGSTGTTVPSLGQTNSGEKQDEGGSTSKGNEGEKRNSKRWNVFELEFKGLWARKLNK